MCALAIVGAGSNLGSREAFLRAAFASLGPGRRSGLYRSAAVVQPGAPSQPDYLNAAFLLETDLEPEALLHRLLSVEAGLGRVRRERWGARTIDLDLLRYDEREISSERLTVPHPRLWERPFVLGPLVDLLPDWEMARHALSRLGGPPEILAWSHAESSSHGHSVEAADAPDALALAASSWLGPSQGRRARRASGQDPHAFMTALSRLGPGNACIARWRPGLIEGFHLGPERPEPVPAPESVAVTAACAKLLRLPSC